jgi:hypothetical protein
LRRSFSFGIFKEIFWRSFIRRILYKKTRFKGNKKLFVWSLISFDDPEQLYFIEGNENTGCYEEILNAYLPDIPKLYSD